MRAIVVKLAPPDSAIRIRSLSYCGAVEPNSSWPKKRAAAAKWRTSKPDADNLAKIVADAMNAIVFADDAQVASLIVQKTYGPLAGVTVTATLLDREVALD